MRRSPRSRSDSHPQVFTISPLLPGAVGAGDDLQEVSFRVLEVHTMATVVVVDLTFGLEVRISPVVLSASLDAGEDLVEVVFGDQERIVLRKDLTVGIVEVVVVEGNAVAHLDNHERPPGLGVLKSENPGEIPS